MASRPHVAAWAMAPVDGAGLYAFRVMFGAVMLCDVLPYLLSGWIDAHFLDPAVRFSYPGLSWVEPLPRAGMIALLVVLAAAGVAVAVGAAYRAAAWVLCLGHAYVFLLEASRYLNHAYLLVVLALLMACMPAARGLSVDAWRRPETASAVVPRWAPWLLRAQLGLVYLYGGLAKVSADWLAGEPVRGWLWQRAQAAPAWPAWISGLLRHELATAVVVHGGLWFDLLIVPALLWRRTRALAVIASLCFHLGNAWLFDLGVFPWLMLLSTTLFFEPSWPRRLPVVGPRLDAWLSPVSEARACSRSRRPWLVVSLCAAWLLVQGLVPLRHHLYPGDVAWTEEGHMFSWRMKVRTKSGAARFIVHAPATGESWVVDPARELSAWQVSKLVGQPELVRQYAHHLAERWRVQQGLHVEVRAQVLVSLDRRPRRLLVDPEVDLAKVRASWRPAPWILPGPTEPVPGPR